MCIHDSLSSPLQALHESVSFPLCMTFNLERSSFTVSMTQLRPFYTRERERSTGHGCAYMALSHIPGKVDEMSCFISFVFERSSLRRSFSSSNPGIHEPSKGCRWVEGAAVWLHPELVFPSPISASVGLDTQKDATAGLTRKSSNAFHTKSQSVSPLPSFSSSPSAIANNEAIPPPPSASPPSVLLERYPSRHHREKQGDAQHTEREHLHSSHTRSLSAGNGSADEVQSAEAIRGIMKGL